MQFYVLLLNSAIALTAANPIGPPEGLFQKGDLVNGEKRRCRAWDGAWGKDCSMSGNCWHEPPTLHNERRWRCVQDTNDQLVQRQRPQSSDGVQHRDAQWEYIGVGYHNGPKLLSGCLPGDDKCECMYHDRKPLGHCKKDADCRIRFGMDSGIHCVSPPFRLPLNPPSVLRRSTSDDLPQGSKPTGQKAAAGYPIDPSHAPKATLEEERKKKGYNGSSGNRDELEPGWPKQWPDHPPMGN